MTYIGNSVFRGCTGLTSVTIPNGVTSIGFPAFEKCTSLTSVTILNPYCAIGDRDHDVFKNCPASLVLHGWLGSTAETYAQALAITFESMGTVDLSGMCGDNVSWTFDSATSALTISGTGAMANYLTAFSAPWHSLKNVILSLSIADGVTGIGNFAFYGCTGLTDVTIPDSMTYIGNSVFRGCTGLTSVTIPNSVTTIGDSAFYGCSGLTSVTIPNGVTSISDSAFYGCSGLTSVTIPDNVTSIASAAFSGCTGLTSITIPNSVTSIGYLAFKDCSCLTDASILNPNCVIGDSDYDVFVGCASGFTLRGLTGSTAEIYATAAGIPFESIGVAPGLSGSCGEHVSWTLEVATGTLTITGTGPITDYSNFSSPFYNSTIIRTAVIESGITTIGENLFENCRNLTSVSIPSTVTGIGYSAFYGCASLTAITIPDSVTSIGNGAFNGCAGLTTITIPDGVTSIGNYAFSGCAGLTTITIPDNVTSIGNGAFKGCVGLTAITIPEGVTSIGDHAFYGCTGLTAMTIPDSVTSIGYLAFGYCSSLTDVTFLGADTVIGDSDLDVFSGCPAGLIIHGYSGSTAETYAAAAGIAFEPFPGGTCGDNVTWALVGDTLTISGTGPMNDFAGYGTVPWLTYRNTIQSIVIEDGVTSVGKCAFGYLPALETAAIADSVTGIGDHAFHFCKALEGISIPDSVQTVGAYAFDSCTAMTAVHIGSGVTSIGTYAFYDCASVTAFTVNGNNTMYSAEDGVLFNKTKATLYYYPNGKTEPSYTLPDSVLMISQIAFLNNRTLETVHLNSSLKTIQSFAFIRCTALQSIVIPSGVTKINQNCFEDCTALTSVTVLNPTMTFGADNIFNRCAALTLYGYPGSTAQTYAAANGIPFVPLLPDPDFFLPAGLTVIEADAFNGIAAQAVFIPAGVTAIEGNPFAGSAVTAVYGYDNTWKTWAESNGYAFALLDSE